MQIAAVEQAPAAATAVGVVPALDNPTVAVVVPRVARTDGRLPVTVSGVNLVVLVAAVATGPDLVFQVGDAQATL